MTFLQELRAAELAALFLLQARLRPCEATRSVTVVTDTHPETVRKFFRRAGNNL
jgi:hypothetical protein